MRAPATPELLAAVEKRSGHQGGKVSALKNMSSRTDVAAAAKSGRLRGEVSGDREHVLLVKPGHNVLHLHRERTHTEAMLEVVELADDVIGRATRDARDQAHTLEVEPVAGDAGEGLAIATGFDQRRATLPTGT